MTLMQTAIRALWWRAMQLAKDKEDLSGYWIELFMLDLSAAHKMALVVAENEGLVEFDTSGADLRVGLTKAGCEYTAMNFRTPVVINTEEEKTPRYASHGAACFDIETNESGQVPAHGSHTFGTGIHVQLHPGQALLVYSRSGMAFKHGVRLVNSVGVIDSDYRGEIQVGLRNDTDTPYSVKKGDRVAQGLIMPVRRVEWVKLKELDPTARGHGGFGSTGR
ncbi:MAG: dUTP diphosphatase [Lautropia sp.]|nr:MAG: dUTP diphosphatase [Lautropia sp.]